MKKEKKIHGKITVNPNNWHIVCCNSVIKFYDWKIIQVRLMLKLPMSYLISLTLSSVNHNDQMANQKERKKKKSVFLYIWYAQMGQYGALSPKSDIDIAKWEQNRNNKNQG